MYAPAGLLGNDIDKAKHRSAKLIHCYCCDNIHTAYYSTRSIGCCQAMIEYATFIIVMRTIPLAFENLYVLILRSVGMCFRLVGARVEV